MNKKIVNFLKVRVEIRGLMNEISALKNDQYGCQAMQMNGMPRGSGISKPTESQAEKNNKTKRIIAEKEKRLKRLKDQQDEVYRFLERNKAKLSKLELDVIWMKYIDGMKNDKIALDLDINYKSVDNKRYNALKKIKRYSDEEERKMHAMRT